MLNRRKMSRSVQKIISWGKSYNGCIGRHNKTQGDYDAEKARKEGKPIRKQHRRASLQTLEDYINYVENLTNVDHGLVSDRYSRADHKELMNWIEEHGDCAASLIEFARKLYNKNRSK